MRTWNTVRISEQRMVKKRLSGLQGVFEPPDMPRIFVGITGTGQIACEMGAELRHQWISDDDVEQVDGEWKEKSGFQAVFLACIVRSTDWRDEWDIILPRPPVLCRAK